MKKYLLFLITISCITLTLNAQEQYEVTCESPLNVRASASINGKVLGCLPKGTSVDVYDVEGDWAVIMYEGKEAYVSAKYLQKCAETLSEDKQNSMIDFMDKINLRQFATHDVEWMAYIIMGLSAVLFIVRRFVREGKNI